MSKKDIYFFLAAIISVLIPVPAHFAYILFILFNLNVIVLVGTGAKILIRKLSLGNLDKPLLLVFIVSLTIIMKQLIVFYSPIIALTLSFAVYITPFASFLIGDLISNDTEDARELFKSNEIAIGKFTLAALLISMLREILAYGTLSLPARNGIIILKTIFNKFGLYSFFWGTIPGMFIIIGVILAVVMFVQRKFEIVRRMN